MCYWQHFQSYIEKMLREAYVKWNSLEEIDAVLNDNMAVLAQGMPNSLSLISTIGK